MSTITEKLSPGITKMIRMDHAHVVRLFHKFDVDAMASRKMAIVESCCLALEIHAQLEEEIFYPALEQVAADHEALKKARPEHQEMRRLIEQLRGMQPGAQDYDTAFRALMRNVLHHVADEETLLLPMAELLLKDRLSELGAQMTKRRLELAAPHAGEMAAHTVRAMPAGTMLFAGGLLAGGYLLKRALGQRHHH